ncbi:Uu.00g019500.m01.CDS01 [Anthostomella pinea]|uniref:Uu.00g019500.m01.CDS01 n=1 Tax=Anthostomella pinea TaxID=933095 RepID=A0AAI8VZB5_9PEZI|nr:Uu.00g019500.m01.CDS01 [Anthostomella pinea]
MPTPEDQELMEQIAQVAGQINRHKAHRDGPGNGTSYPARGSYHRAAPYPHTGYRGGRTRPTTTYRNKTLVLNGQSQAASAASPTEENVPVDPTTPSYVTKNDRHLQLINKSVYEKEAQHRAQAIDHTTRRQWLQRDNREKARFMNTIQPHRTNSVAGPPTPLTSASRYEIEVGGVRFHVVQQGSKLIKAPDDVNPPSATPKEALIGGVKFHRTKNGNLVRHGIVKAQRLAVGVKKVNEQCKTFAWNGSCPKGPTCRYIHDASKTAVCRDWLLKGECLRGDACDLSHEVTDERTPLCMHFAKGKCNNALCSYIHVEHAQTDPVCRAFGIYGYCDMGTSCPDRHVFECPDFSNTGICKMKGCKRAHIDRASVLRKASLRGASEEMEDLSSDDEGAAADSDDVDSDEVEEFIRKDDDDLDFADQKDFIGFR